ncbi:uncharacterized protein LOC121718438 [Alosa sapidissima]|uniref:uncharacterized protein LOC121718438 n=1 Tax=Alosa sapidissima TaxID=34773 RepID=UPI001C092ACF|nr:uncharacterized protein LOC121718438 [Alosa sapidissima]
MSYRRGYISTPFGESLGRGRGIPIVLDFDSPVQGGDVHVVGDSQIAAAAPIASGVGFSSQNHHTEHAPNTQVVDTSTPITTPLLPDIVSQMSDIIRNVGQQLADSVIARLSPTQAVPTPSTAHMLSTPTNTSTQSLDLSQVQLVPHRKVKEHPTFRGDSTDTVNVREWEDLMRSYVKKTNIKAEQQAEEILTHLRGKAKDVVKFGIRNSGIKVIENPEAIYGLLRKHFAAVPCSPLPLADFYTTLPKSDEGAYDYWLRLHQAADVATVRLKEQGKTLDCPALEVTRMFIKNCPSRELAMTFRSKTIDKWSVEEVQDVLDEYHNEIRSKGTVSVNRKLNENVHVNKVEMPCAGASLPDRQDLHAAKSTESPALNRVITMLEKILLQRATPAQAMSNRASTPRLHRIEGLNSMPCAVCSDAKHSALTHCRDKKLCFLCHSPDHSRRSCPAQEKSAQSGN